MKAYAAIEDPVDGHRSSASKPNGETLSSWTPQILLNLERLSSSVQGHPHVENLGRWRRIVETCDMETLRTILGSFYEDELPDQATMSTEIPIQPTSSRFLPSLSASTAFWQIKRPLIWQDSDHFGKHVRLESSLANSGP